jgi:hypothetical protein
MRKQVEEQIKQLEEMDVIEKVGGPTPWVSPLTFRYAIILNQWQFYGQLMVFQCQR